MLLGCLVRCFLLFCVLAVCFRHTSQCVPETVCGTWTCNVPEHAGVLKHELADVLADFGRSGGETPMTRAGAPGL